MDEDLAHFAVNLALDSGAEYAETRLHRTRDLVGVLKNGQLEPSIVEDAYGLGFRLLYNGALAFSATNESSRSSVRALVETALRRAKSSLSMLKHEVRFSREKAHKARWAAKEVKKIEDVGVDTIAETLSDLDLLAVSKNPNVRIPNRYLTLLTSLEEKVFVNSDGSVLRSRVPRVEFFAYLTAFYNGNSMQRLIQLGESGGWEAIKRLNPHEELEESARILGEILIKAVKPPADTLDLIVSPEIAGIMAHESSGHPGEADRILGREAAQAGESYIEADDIGRKIGSEEAFVSDDPTISNSFGYYLYDDEGIAARKRRLIDHGRLTEFLHNRSTAHSFKLKSNGASRSIRFDREPIVRMGNTFVEPGDYSFEELLEGVKHGVYIKSFMEWNIDDKRLNQRYAGLEAYLIERGELRGLVKNPVLEVTTPKLWGSVDARASDLQFTSGSCGKGDPDQPCPVWHGGPHMRLRDLRLGTR